MAEGDLWEVGQSSWKKDFWWKLDFCKTNLPPENQVISNKQPILQAVFSFYFSNT